MRSMKLQLAQGEPSIMIDDVNGFVVVHASRVNRDGALPSRWCRLEGFFGAVYQGPIVQMPMLLASSIALADDVYDEVVKEIA